MARLGLEEDQNINQNDYGLLKNITIVGNYKQSADPLCYFPGEDYLERSFYRKG